MSVIGEMKDEQILELEKKIKELEKENKELKEKINQMSAALYNIRQWTYIGFLSKKED